MHAATNCIGTPSKTVSDQSASAAFYCDAAHNNNQIKDTSFAY